MCNTKLKEALPGACRLHGKGIAGGDDLQNGAPDALGTATMASMEPSNDIPPSTPRRRHRKLIVALLVLAIAACALAAAFLAYAGDYYHDADTTGQSLASTPEVPVERGDGYLAFGDPSAETGIVIYPGAKVEYSAYAPLMRDLAERGYFAVVVQMPFNFAFFDINAADRVRAAYPQVDGWWVGGHSLGGSMAAQYAADHSDDPALEGVVLLAAYSASDLSASSLGAIVIYGSEDRVLNRDKLRENGPLLPESAVTVEIAGGNHAGFGDYGPQDGDGAASVDPAEQRAETADAVDAYIAGRSAEDRAA